MDCVRRDSKAWVISYGHTGRVCFYQNVTIAVGKSVQLTRVPWTFLLLMLAKISMLENVASSSSSLFIYLRWQLENIERLVLRNLFFTRSC